jgi:hypothetical protein
VPKKRDSKKGTQPHKRTIEEIVLKSKTKWPEGIHNSRIYHISRKCPQESLREAMVRPISLARDGIRIRVKIIGDHKEWDDGDTVLIHPRYLDDSDWGWGRKKKKRRKYE